MIEIDPLSDDVLTLAQLCTELPRGRRGAKPHISTAVRWIEVGAGPRDSDHSRPIIRDSLRRPLADEPSRITRIHRATDRSHRGFSRADANA